MNRNDKGIWHNDKWTGNGIGDSGGIKISESLMKNTTLTTLDMSGVI